MRIRLFLAASLLLVGMQISLHGFPMDGWGEESQSSFQKSATPSRQENRSEADSKASADELDNEETSRGSFLNTNESVLESESAETLRIKEAFAQAQMAWRPFSDAMKAFPKKADTANFDYSDIKAAADVAADAAANAANAANAAAYAASAAAYAYAAYSTDTARTARVARATRAANAAEAVAEAARDARAAARAAEAARDAVNARVAVNAAVNAAASAYVRAYDRSDAAAYAADRAIGTPFEEETRWTADAIQETVGFCRAVKNFYAKKADSLTKINNEQMSFKTSLNPSREMIQRGLSRPGSKNISFAQINNVIKNNPTFSRFIIEERDGELVLQPDSLYSWLMSRVLQSPAAKLQNQQVAFVLKALLENEYDEATARELVQDEDSDWSAARISRLLETARQKKEPMVETLIPIDIRDYPNARIIASGKIVDPNNNKEKNVHILEALGSEKSYIRIEDEINSTGRTNRLRMIADHLLVELPKGNDIDSFRCALNELLKPQGLIIKKENIFDKKDCFYELHFKPTLESLPVILRAVRELGGESAPDFIMAEACASDPYYARQWNLHDFYGINAPQAWSLLASGPTLTAITVAVLDTGIHLHEDFQNDEGQSSLSLTNSCHFDFLKNNDTAALQDSNGHGTHCAGIIAAMRDNGRGIAGIFDRAQLMSCKVSEDGKNYTRDRINRALAHAWGNQAQIYNGSFGGILNKDGRYPEYGFDDVKGIIQKLNRTNRDLGVSESLRQAIFVVAAGNNEIDIDENTPFPASLAYHPAMNPQGAKNIIVVAATDRRGQLASFSNYGKRRVDLAAPGKSIWSTVPPESIWQKPLEDPLFMFEPYMLEPYSKNSGTSMAAPHCTAALALMKIRFLKATAEQLILRLCEATDPIVTFQYGSTKAHENVKTKYGRLNLAHALRKDLVGTFADLEEDDASLLPDEGKNSKEAIAVRNAAERQSIIAECKKNQLNVWRTGVSREERWTAVIEHGTDVEGLWAEVVERFREGRDAAADLTRAWWEQELGEAARELDRWNETLHQWNQEKNGTCTIS